MNRREMDLDKQIVAIQRSTRTILKFLAPAHNWLRMNFALYYKWSSKPLSHAIHWVVLFYFILSLPFMFADQFNIRNVDKTKAENPTVTYDFPRWEWVNPNPSANTLRGVHAYDSQNIWAVGMGGTILKYSGSEWIRHYPEDNANFNAVFTLNPVDSWAVGQDGAIFQYNGVIWYKQISGTSNQLNSVYASNYNNVWAVGNEGTFLHFDGDRWVPINIGTHRKD